MSSFTRIIIVLSFLRQAMGIQQLPPNQVVVGLSLFLTLFVMGPTYDKINDAALKPYLANKIGFEEFMDKSSVELSTFMLKYTKRRTLPYSLKHAKLKAEGRKTSSQGQRPRLCHKRVEAAIPDRVPPVTFPFS